MEAIFHRTSIRQFEDKQIEEDKLEKIMRAAMQAPSAGNQRPWEFYLVTDKDKLEQLAQASPYAGPARKAPMAIVPCYRTTLRFPECAEIDMAIATENIMLEADTLGLGSVMLAVAPLQDRIDAVRKALDVPETLIPFAIVPLGYPVKVNPQQDRYEADRIHRV